MSKPIPISNVTVEYKGDEEAKERFVNYIINCLLNQSLLNEGGEEYIQ